MNKISRLFISIVCLFMIFCLSSCGTKEISGDEWLLKQDETMSNLQNFAAAMDEVYSLYISNTITPEDFSNELLLLNDQYTLIQADYTVLEQEYSLLPESYSYAAQRGVSAVNSIQELLQRLLDDSTDEFGNVLSRERISYLYLAYRQELNGYLAEYITAYQIIFYGGTTNYG